MADITVSITIPSDKVALVQQGFLRSRPKPDEPVYTDKQWFCECIADYIERQTKQGLQTIAAEGIADVAVVREP